MDRKTVIKRKLRQFKEEMSKDFSVSNMYFFGSHARGKPHKYSDIDLLIVSPKFRKLNFFKRGAKMYDYWNLNYPVDFLCYTPEEFKRLSKRVTILREAVEEGIKI